MLTHELLKHFCFFDFFFCVLIKGHEGGDSIESKSRNHEKGFFDLKKKCQRLFNQNLFLFLLFQFFKVLFLLQKKSVTHFDLLRNRVETKKNKKPKKKFLSRLDPKLQLLSLASFFLSPDFFCSEKNCFKTKLVFYLFIYFCFFIFYSSLRESRWL